MAAGGGKDDASTGANPTASQGITGVRCQISVFFVFVEKTMGHCYLQRLSVVSQVGSHAFICGLHVRLGGVPAGRTNAGSGCGMNDGIKHAQGFIHVAPQGKVVDGLVLNDPIRVDNKASTQGKGGIFVEEIVTVSDLAILIS